MYTNYIQIIKGVSFLC